MRNVLKERGQKQGGLSKDWTRRAVPTLSYFLTIWTLRIRAEGPDCLKCLSISLLLQCTDPMDTTSALSTSDQAEIVPSLHSTLPHPALCAALCELD